MSLRNEIETAILALEEVLAYRNWSEAQRSAIKAAVMHAILIKRQRERR